MEVCHLGQRLYIVKIKYLAMALTQAQSLSSEVYRIVDTISLGQRRYIFDMITHSPGHFCGGHLTSQVIVSILDLKSITRINKGETIEVSLCNGI